MNINKKKKPFLGLLLLLPIGMLFVPECDDCYFTYWNYENFWDFLLTVPIREEGVVLAVPANGRYLGNLLGVLLGKLYLTPLAPLRGVIMGLGLIALTVLLARRLRSDALCASQGLSLAFALVVFAPRGIWQQVYAWGAAWVNYLLPVLGILLLLEWWERRDRCRWKSIACMSFACCLFMEPITILLATWGVVAAAGALLKRIDWDRGTALFFGSVLGTAVMFSAPGYAQAGSDTRNISLSLLTENLPIIFIQTVFRPAVVACAISTLLVYLLRRQGCRMWQVFAFLLFPLHLVALLSFVRDLGQEWESYSHISLCAGVVMALLWSTMLLLWRGEKLKQRCIGAVFSLLMVTAPLLVVSPIGPRNFFASYLCLCVTALELYRAARHKGGRNWAAVRIPAMLAAVALVGLYACNYLIYHQRLTYGQEQAALGAQEVALPLLPFSGWATNEFVGKGDLSYLIYQEKPWDVKLTFVPYGEYDEFFE